MYFIKKCDFFLQDAVSVCGLGYVSHRMFGDFVEFSKKKKINFFSNFTKIIFSLDIYHKKFNHYNRIFSVKEMKE